MEKTKSEEINSFDILGIGNAIVDVLAHASETFLSEHTLNKGNMTLIDESKAEKIYLSMKNCTQSSGGSAANTLVGISQLGGKAAFIGRVKNDKLGEIFTEEINTTGTLFKTPFINEGPSTARCLILVTPDAERTMCTYLGTSVFLQPKDLNYDLIRNSKILYLEGYLFDSGDAKESFFKAAKISKENINHRVALSLSDTFCVDRHRDGFIKLLNDYVDIVFANESEILSLYERKNLEEALDDLQGKCEVAIITRGIEGSIILTKENRIYIEPKIFGKAIDSTGAGDLYAAGFLYGYINKMDLKICGEMGSICSGHIVTKIGSRTETSLHELIDDNIKN